MCDNRCESNRQLLNLFDKAVLSGSVFFYESRLFTTTDQGYTFHIRLCPGLAKKESNDYSVTKRDPFLPYDKESLIEELPETDHVLLFNKFSLVKPHVLLITKSFQPQDKNCTKKDFEAVKTFYDRYGEDFVMFYNCGPLSGASQPHRHFQFVPSADCGVPILGKHIDCSTETLFDMYSVLLRDVKSNSFNLLFSPKWGLYLIERCAERCSLGISINSLGFLGCILVKKEEDVNRIIEKGPHALLMEILEK